MASWTAENDCLVGALQHQYAPYYAVQAARALKALRPLLAEEARERFEYMPIAMATGGGGGYLIRPGQTAVLRHTLADASALLDERFYHTEEVRGRQALETATNAVQLLEGYERGLRAALTKHYPRYCGGAAFQERIAPEFLPQPFHLSDVVDMLDMIQADAHSMQPPPLSQGLSDYIETAGVCVELRNGA